MGNCSTKEDDNNDDPSKPPKSIRRLSITAGEQPGGGRSAADMSSQAALGPTDVDEGEEISDGIRTRFCAKSLAGKSNVHPPIFKENQDDYIALLNVNKHDVCVYGALDGHGRNGALASAYLKQEMLKSFKGCKEKDLLGNAQKALETSFSVSDNNLCRNNKIDTSLSGSTAVVCHKSGANITCANCGDSRCVIGQVSKKGKFKAKDISFDHKPENPEETKRIVASGGQVEPMHDMYDQCVGPHRVWVANEMTPGLAMSRSLGDEVAHSVGVSSIPEITTHTLDLDTDRFMILASDGVWEFIESQEAVELVASCATPEEAADLLLSESVKRWEAEEEVVDDITALVLFFDAAAPAAATGE